jgi:hypothetical protein
MTVSNGFSLWVMKNITTQIIPVYWAITTSTYAETIYSWNGHYSWYGGVIGGTADTYNVTVQTWHHVMTSWDGTTRYIYLDGVLNMTYTNAADPFTNGSTNAYIGCNQAATQDFNGSIDEFAYWRRNLTQADDTFLYNGSAGVGFSAICNASAAVYTVFNCSYSGSGNWVMGCGCNVTNGTNNVFGNNVSIIAPSGSGNQVTLLNSSLNSTGVIANFTNFYVNGFSASNTCTVKAWFGIV